MGDLFAAGADDRAGTPDVWIRRGSNDADGRGRCRSVRRDGGRASCIGDFEGENVDVWRVRRARGRCLPRGGRMHGVVARLDRWHGRRRRGGEAPSVDLGPSSSEPSTVSDSRPEESAPPTTVRRATPTTDRAIRPTATTSVPSTTSRSPSPLTGWDATDAYLERRLVGNGDSAASFAISIDGEIVHTAAFGIRSLVESDPAEPERSVSHRQHQQDDRGDHDVAARRRWRGRARRPGRRARRANARVSTPSPAARPTSPFVNCLSHRRGSLNTRTCSSVGRFRRVARRRSSGSHVPCRARRGRRSATAT